MTKRLLFPFILLFSQIEVFSQKLPDLIPYRKGELWGYCDSTKKIVIEPKYKSVLPFSDGMAQIEISDSKSGFINSSGKLIFTYNSKDTLINDFYFNRARVLDLRSGKFVFVDKNGRVVIPLQFDDINEEVFTGFIFSYSPVMKRKKFGFLGKEKYGIIDTIGNFILPFQKGIDFIYQFSEVFAGIQFETGGIEIFDTKKRKFILGWENCKDTIEQRQFLLKNGYSNKEVNLLGHDSSEKEGWLRIEWKHGTIIGYTDKYGTKYWEDL